MKKEEKVNTQITSWKPTIAQMKKIEEMKNKLIIMGNTAIVIKAIGELYEKTTGKSWA